jgi:predicted DNA-binding protein (MmcQ/YjbR family)
MRPTAKERRSVRSSRKPKGAPKLRQRAAGTPAAQGGAAARDGRVLERLRKICMALPEAQEKLSHGEPTWFAGRGKVFASFDGHHHGAKHLSVHVPAPPGLQEALIESDPARYRRPPYVGHLGWVAVVLDVKPDWGVVAGLVEQAFRLVASAKLVAKLPPRPAGD